MPGGRAENLEPCLQRVVALDELQLRRAAAEQRGEQLLEVGVDLLERLVEPLPALAVEALDAATELGDSRDQVIAILHHQVELFANLFCFLLGPEVHPAQPLALRLQPIDL